MTIRPLRFEGRSAPEILIGQRDLTDRVIAAVAATNPAEHGTGEASLAADIRWAVEHNLRGAADALEGVETDDELLRASAVRRFEEGSSFTSVIAAYHRGVSVIWSELASRTTDGEDLAVAGERLLRHLERITVSLAEEYGRNAAAFDSVERDARFAIFTALTQGGDAVEVAHRIGWALSERYGVLVLRLRVGDGEAPESVTARRTTRRLRDAIERAASGDVLAVLGPRGGTALVPVPVPVPGGGPEAGGIGELLRRSLTDAFAAGFTAAWTEADASGIPDAMAVAEELADLAEALPDARAFVTLDDLALEYQSARPGPARALLAGRLDPLGAELRGTVEVYLASGGDRRATALALTVHPNTVDYRLGRVARLTGLDATTPEGAAHLRAGLVARRLTGENRASIGSGG